MKLGSDINGHEEKTDIYKIFHRFDKLPINLKQSFKQGENLTYQWLNIPLQY